MAEARLPPDKTLEGFDFAHVPMLSKARVLALASGDTWLEKGANLLLFGPPGSGESHISAALARASIENGYRALFARTTDLVQRLQTARQELAELISRRYERRSLLITANQPFSASNNVFPDSAMTVAAIDRLVHHAVVVEMNVESYRQRSATARKGRAAAAKRAEQPKGAPVSEPT